MITLESLLLELDLMRIKMVAQEFWLEVLSHWDVAVEDKDCQYIQRCPF